MSSCPVIPFFRVYFVRCSELVFIRKNAKRSIILDMRANTASFPSLLPPIVSIKWGQFRGNRSIPRNPLKENLLIFVRNHRRTKKGNPCFFGNKACIYLRIVYIYIWCCTRPDFRPGLQSEIKFFRNSLRVQKNKEKWPCSLRTRLKFAGCRTVSGFLRPQSSFFSLLPPEAKLLDAWAFSL